MIEHHDDLLLLVRAVNQDTPSPPSFAIVVIGMVDISAPTIQIKQFTVLRNYASASSDEEGWVQEQDFMSFRMVPHLQIENLIYIFNKEKLLCVDCEFVS